MLHTPTCGDAFGGEQCHHRVCICIICIGVVSVYIVYNCVYYCVYYCDTC
jgi:hypothetical protein